MQERRRGGFRRLAVLFAVASVGVLAVGAHAASAASIEICKSSANGMAGQSFTFSVNGGSAITVIGGRCSGAITVNGAATITEAQSNPPTDVSAIVVRPSVWQVSQNLPGRSVSINTGTSTSNGLVTFTDEPAGGNFGTLKVCKLTTTPGFIGSLFSFQVGPVGGPLGPAVSTPANDAFADPSLWTCTILGTFQVGSNVHVHEQIPAGVQVQFIDTDPGTALGAFDTSTGDANVTVGAGATTVLYDDEPIPTSQTGFMEVCKQATLINGVADPAVSGPFNFTVVDSNGTTYQKTVTVPSPNNGLVYCTPPFAVAAGLATVTEQANPNFQLDDIFTVPANAQVAENDQNLTTTVDVPVSASSNNEVEVHFVNSHARGQLKICKLLGANSQDLASMTFFFRVTDVTDPSNPVVLSGPGGFPVPAGICTIFGDVPIGSTIDVHEILDRTVAPGSFIDTSGEGPVTIASGVNTVNITNTAKGNLEICKRLSSAFNPPAPVFGFRVDGGSQQNVQASLPGQPLKCITLRVSVGAHTVTEINSTNFELDASRADGGITVIPSSAEISRSLANRSVTVNVPFAGDTTTIFTNRIRQFQLKICKFATPGSTEPLSSVLFNYNFTVDEQEANGILFPAGGGIHVGECAFASDAAGNPRNFNVINPDGTPANVSIGEQNASNATPVPFGFFFISNIQVSGRRTGPGTTYKVNPVPNPQSPITGLQYILIPGTPWHVIFTPGPGVNEADFTNTAGG